MNDLLSLTDVTGAPARVGDVVVDPRGKLLRLLPTPGTYAKETVAYAVELKRSRAGLRETGPGTLARMTMCLVISEQEATATPLPELFARRRDAYGARLDRLQYAAGQHS